MKENGHLHTTVSTANETLSKQAQKMGINIEQVISEIEDRGKLEQDLLGTITSSDITEKLLSQMDTLDM